MEKLLAKKKKDGPMLSDNEKHAKMSVLHDLRNQASQAMGEKLVGMKTHAAGLAPHKFGGPGDHSNPEHGTVAGIADGNGPGSMHPHHGIDSGALKLKEHEGAAGAIDDDDDDGPGDAHPEHGSVGSEHDSEGPGDDHPEHGSVSGHDDAEGPGDHENPEAVSGDSDSDEYSHLGVDEIDKHLAKLMAHKKRLTGK